MFFSPYLTQTEQWLLIAAVICVLISGLIYLLRVRPVALRRRKAEVVAPPRADADYEPASVIVYSQGEDEQLRTLLESLLDQDYPAAYEVIVVNDGESPDVRDTVSMLRSSHPNLYLTFTPEGVMNLSRKKLGITLGVKAARYDVLLFTTTAVSIPSRRWLRSMARHFGKDSAVELVIGFACVDPDEDRTGSFRRRAYDYVADAVRWLGVAVAGKPFRGTEYNIAYRKSLFIKNKGFARSFNLHAGDDDVFISEIATGANTAVELGDDSLVTVSHGNHPRVFNERMMSHYFTESFIGRRPRFLYILPGLLQLASIALTVAASVLAWPNALAAAVALLIAVGIAVIDIAVWRNIMQALRSRTMLFTIPWFTLTYPLRKIWGRFLSLFSRDRHYTWN